MTRREQSKQVFTKAEWFVFATLVAGAIYALIGLLSGTITI
jgi:hypothetical protein